MKRLKYISYTLAIGIVSFSSCNKLDEFNPGGATADAVYSTPQGFVTLVNAAYSEARYWYVKEDGMFLSETGTDIWINENNGSYAQQFTKYNGLSGSSGNPNKVWKQIWRGINHCNAGIGRIDNAGFTSEVEKNMRLAELRFLRAFYYWHVVEQWGGVMLRTKETNSAELTAERSPVEDFYALIIDDLTFAKDHLPIEWGNDYSRATKKSAMGMLARVYLTRASYSTATDANAWFTKARDMANDVIAKQDELKTSLWENINDLWDPKYNKRNKEALFTISNSSTATTTNYDPKGNLAHNWYINNYAGKPGLIGSTIYGRTSGRRLMPTLYLLNLYTEGDARYEATFQEKWYSNKRTGTGNTPFKWDANNIKSYNKDVSVVGKTIDSLELAMVVTRNAVPTKATETYVVFDKDDIYAADGKAKNNAQSYQAMFPVLKKFLDPYRTDFTQEAGYQDIMVIRLAEMYLISAEAELKLGNLIAAAEKINKLRKRAIKPGYDAAMTVAPANISAQFILEERARELCGEFVRWYDLKRMWQGADWTKYIKDRNPDITAIQDYHRLRPIRQEELDALLNGKEFGQTLGY